MDREAYVVTSKTVPKMESLHRKKEKGFNTNASLAMARGSSLYEIHLVSMG
jgi:hypothetical protein